MRTKYINKRPLCACGCGEFVNQSKLHPHRWNIYVHGHQSKGSKHSEETKIKIGKRSKRRKHSEETKLKISKGNKGKNISTETKRKMSKAGKGRKFSKEHKRKIGKAHMGYKHSKEAKLKMSMSTSGENNPNWQGRISCEPYCDVWSDKEYKQSIRDRDNNKCQNPDCPKKHYDRLLDIHHINYNKKNCVPRNLIALCRSCNIQANTNRERWIIFYQEIIERKHKLKETT